MLAGVSLSFCGFHDHFPLLYLKAVHYHELQHPLAAVPQAVFVLGVQQSHFLIMHKLSYRDDTRCGRLFFAVTDSCEFFFPMVLNLYRIHPECYFILQGK